MSRDGFYYCWPDEKPEKEVSHKAAAKATKVAKPSTAKRPRVRKASRRKTTTRKPIPFEHGASRKAERARELARGLARAGNDGVESRIPMDTAIRRLVIRRPGRSVTDIVERLERRGYDASPVTVSVIRADTRAVMKLAQELGIDVRKKDLGPIASV
jgi:hypothetical protein